MPSCAARGEAGSIGSDWVLKIWIIFRAKMFSEIGHDGYVSLEQWITWASDHILSKESKLTLK